MLCKDSFTNFYYTNKVSTFSLLSPFENVLYNASEQHKDLIDYYRESFDFIHRTV